MSYLNAGSILFIDLSNRKITREPTSSLSRQFIGGRGINTKLLYDNVPPEVDALDPENFLLFGTGPLGGTTCPGSGRIDVMAKSPQTGLMGISGIGGRVPVELKFAGYDNIAITGKADKPVYIWINDGQVEIRDASSLWGKDTYMVPALIREELGDPEVKVLCIGPAGENLVRYATVQSGIGAGAGRTGMGAVMGSKKLKAIAVRGTRGLNVANPGDFLVKSQQVHQQLLKHPNAIEMRDYGQAKMVDEAEGHTGQHTQAQNFQRSFWEHEKDVSAYAFWKKHPSRKMGCFGCPLQCKDAYNIPGVAPGGIYCKFYFHMTWSTALTNMNAWYESCVLCQRLGIDLVSLSIMLAWTMELYQRGIITAKDTNGIPMEWGSREAIIEMTKKIVRREGFGDVLAEGILPAARKIGKGSEEFAMHVKGLPMALYPYNARAVWALSAAVGPRGDPQLGCCPRDDPKTYSMSEGKAILLMEVQDNFALADCLGICRLQTTPVFQTGVPEELGVRLYTELYSLGIGESISHEEVMEVVKKGIDLGRAYDCREGLTREQERIPKRFLDKMVTEGPRKGGMIETEKLEKMKSEYYALRGWDVATGVPTRETLKKRGLSDVAKDLERRGKLPKTVEKAAV